MHTKIQAARLLVYQAATDKDNGDSTRVRALEILGKIYGAYAPEKQEVTTYSSTFFADIDDVEQENPPENNDLH